MAPTTLARLEAPTRDGAADADEAPGLLLPSGAHPRPGGGEDPADDEGGLPPLAHARALGRLVRRHEHWRLFPELRHAARYIDIETTGLEPNDPITVVGVSDGRSTCVLVRGRGLSARALAGVLADARLLVTFNGTGFDLPRLRAAFPGLPWDLPHFDLAVEGRQVGLGGGLKAVERALGLARPRELQGVGGLEAARLWRAHQTGDEAALRRLVRYCRADVDGLVALAPRIHDRLARAAADDDPGRLLVATA
ncbi:MAG: ribonuclease H-like domain-containing protein [Planctomycetes bacterium]|nr:ribonuclease H-like domain-containing protein [Planctomycetota bacterium]